MARWLRGIRLLTMEEKENEEEPKRKRKKEKKRRDGASETKALAR